MQHATENVIKAVAVTAELTGTELSRPALTAICSDLADYPEKQVLGALVRCRRELKGRMTLADILLRLDDGRPGPEEAWAMMPTCEEQTVVWTREMATAYAVAAPLLERGDKVAARLAFIESYKALLATARNNRVEVKWSVCLGWDARGREQPLLDAVKKGRMTHDDVAGFLPAPEGVATGLMKSLESLGDTKLLKGPAT